MAQKQNKSNRVVSYFSEYEMQLIASAREKTGEKASQFVRRITRLFLKGELIKTEKSIW